MLNVDIELFKREDGGDFQPRLWRRNQVFYTDVSSFPHRNRVLFVPGSADNNFEISAT